MNYLNLLSSVGLHIGTSCSVPNVDPYIYQYLLGIRNGFYIFNLPVSIFLLRRTLFFIEKVASINPYNCICASHSNIQDSELLQSIYATFHKDSLQPILISSWMNGTFTNWNNMVFGMVRSLFSRKKDRLDYSFQVILAKMVFILMKRSLRMDELTFYKQYNLMSRFWKFLLLFQFFIHLRKLPSSFFYISSSSKIYPINECVSLNIPVLSMVDSDNSLNGITYPIPGNKDSLLSISLILNLVNHSIAIGKFRFYTVNDIVL